MEKISFILFVVSHQLIIGVLPYEIQNDNSPLQEALVEDYFELPKFPLYKCHCKADQIWENGKCLAMKTGVDFIISFSQSVLTKEVGTSEFSEVVIGEHNCSSTMFPLSIQNVAFTMHKTLFHLESGENFTHQYCVEHVKNGKGDVVLQADVCLSTLQVPACCPPSHYLNPSTYKCYTHENDKVSIKPPVHMASILINTTSLHTYLQKPPSCNPKLFERKVLRLLDTSVTLQYQQSQIIFFEWQGSSSQRYPLTVRLPMDYCIALERHGNRLAYTVTYWDELSPLYCSNATSNYLEEEEVIDKCDEVMSWLLTLLLSISCVFLFLILLLHAAMPELRKSLGSKITICHVASLFFGFLLLLMLRIPYPFNCKVIGPLVQICFLATFFWLNVMCFDIWWKLRCRSPAGETIQSSRLKFLRYSFYGWGAPLLVGVVTIVMDNVSSLEEVPGVIVPGFGNKHCWFADRSATLVYYFGIIAVLMAANAFFFAWVFVILFKANCTYEKVLKNSQKTSARTWIYLNIFGVMGITWIFEFLSWQEGTCKYWVVSDIVNALRGLILFLIFFANKTSITKIGQRFSIMNQTLHDQLSRSVISLRKISLKPSSGTLDTAQTGIDSRRSSETNTELSKRSTNPDTENGNTGGT